MEITNVHLVYFSATFTTRKIVREIGRAIGAPVTEHDVTCGLLDSGSLTLGAGSVLVAGVPVYAGRIPRPAAEALKGLKGCGAPAVLVCVYGNRDYYDALAELQDVVERQGCKAVAAGAFIGRHCIFPKVAAGRPDADDMAKAAAFGSECAGLISRTADFTALPRLAVKGNRPYKQGGTSTFCPTGDASLCNGCLACASQCPAGAIPQDTPCATDAGKCMACGRCVVVCPTGARAFRGEAYKGFEAKFTAAFSARREPETFFTAGI